MSTRPPNRPVAPQRRREGARYDRIWWRGYAAGLGTAFRYEREVDDAVRDILGEGGDELAG